MKYNFRDIAKSQKAGWSDVSTYKATLILNKYNVPYKSNKNNSVTFYVEDETYIFYGKSNRVYNYLNEKSATNTEMTLLQFIKSKSLEEMFDENSCKVLSYEMTFGKYRNISLKEIMLSDLSYLKWAKENLDIEKNKKLIDNINYLYETFSLDEEDFEYLEKRELICFDFTDTEDMINQINKNN